MKRQVWENKSNKQLCVTIPRNSGISPGDVVTVSNEKIKKVVYSTLVGDLLHYGHLQLLEKARQLGDYNICGVQTDKAVKSYRKEPISNFNERKAVVSCLKCVDKVMSQDSLDPTKNLKEIHKEFPNAEIILVHGSNWDKIPGADFVEKIGGRIIKFPYYEKLSDFNIINKIVKNYKSKFDKIQKFDTDLNKTPNDKETRHELISTKANTLKSLHKILTKAKIERPFIFTISDWEKKKEKIISSIQDQFREAKIVVRSSATNEDTFSNSMAGAYRSILDVDSSKPIEIKAAIEDVINSYKEKGFIDKASQVLIQKKTQEIKCSGVIFTRETVNGAPYYIVNYDDTTGSTDTVTKGVENKIVKISYFSKQENLGKWRNLLEAVNELEKVIPGLPIDIEFGIKNTGEIIFFQVRPITMKAIIEYANSDFRVKKEINMIKEKYRQTTKSKYRVFSDMSFWNPSELIGDFPNPLDHSLFKNLITDTAWQELLVKADYSKTPQQLMYLFGNKPYIDVTKVFELLTPTTVSESTKNKLLTFYHKKLKENPELHDKVEFDIIVEPYNFSIDKKLSELRENGFNEAEIDEIKRSLFSHTNNLIKNYKEHIKKADKALDLMDKKRIDVSMSNLDKKENLKILLEDCKNLGTNHFSLIARLAFIGKSFLKSLAEKNIVDQEFYEKFLSSLNTIASDFQKDVIQLNRGSQRYSDFTDKYGHLRPGTYDITSQSYRSYPESFFQYSHTLKDNSTQSIKLPESVYSQIDNILKKENFSFDARHLLNFMKECLEKREEIKFRFTKNLSNSLEIISEIGLDLKLSKDDLSKIPLTNLLSCLEMKNRKSARKKLLDLIQKKQELLTIQKKILLPPIIFSEEDLDIVEISKAKPNFVTQKSVSRDGIFLRTSSSPSSADLSGKIVLIENADPGFDWILTKNIAGLITKYGGAASHMAIRCSEFEIPAAIGCGEELFNRVVNSTKISLDCKSEKLGVI